MKKSSDTITQSKSAYFISATPDITFGELQKLNPDTLQKLANGIYLQKPIITLEEARKEVAKFHLLLASKALDHYIDDRCIIEVLDDSNDGEFELKNITKIYPHKQHDNSFKVKTSELQHLTHAQENGIAITKSALTTTEFKINPVFYIFAFSDSFSKFKKLDEQTLDAIIEGINPETYANTQTAADALATYLYSHKLAVKNKFHRCIVAVVPQKLGQVKKADIQSVYPSTAYIPYQAIESKLNTTYFLMFQSKYATDLPKRKEVKLGHLGLMVRDMITAIQPDYISNSLEKLQENARKLDSTLQEWLFFEIVSDKKPTDITNKDIRQIFLPLICGSDPLKTGIINPFFKKQRPQVTVEDYKNSLFIMSQSKYAADLPIHRELKQGHVGIMSKELTEAIKFGHISTSLKELQEKARSLDSTLKKWLFFEIISDKIPTVIKKENILRVFLPLMYGNDPSITEIFNPDFKKQGPEITVHDCKNSLFGDYENLLSLARINTLKIKNISEKIAELKKEYSQVNFTLTVSDITYEAGLEALKKSSLFNEKEKEAAIKLHTETQGELPIKLRTQLSKLLEQLAPLNKQLQELEEIQRKFTTIISPSSSSSNSSTSTVSSTNSLLISSSATFSLPTASPTLTDPIALQ